MQTSSMMKKKSRTRSTRCQLALDAALQRQNILQEKLIKYTGKQL